MPLGLNCKIVDGLMVTSPALPHGIAVPELEKLVAQAGGEPDTVSVANW
jgi:hypothetical protein